MFEQEELDRSAQGLSIRANSRSKAARSIRGLRREKGLLSEQQKSGLKDIGSVLPLTPEKCG
jgi:hypothetical protein